MKDRSARKPCCDKKCAVRRIGPLCCVWRLLSARHSTLPCLYPVWFSGLIDSSADLFMPRLSSLILMHLFNTFPPLHAPSCPRALRFIRLYTKCRGGYSYDEGGYPVHPAEAPTPRGHRRLKSSFRDPSGRSKSKASMGASSVRFPADVVSYDRGEAPGRDVTTQFQHKCVLSVTEMMRLCYSVSLSSVLQQAHARVA